ncbi:MAG: hypothetical protein AB7S67_13555, partial [Thiomonas sp.]
PKAASNSLSVIPDPVPAQVQLTHSKLKRGQNLDAINCGDINHRGGFPARDCRMVINKPVT